MDPKTWKVSMSPIKMPFVHAKVANYEVHRVFFDTGSSSNVIFHEALDQMDLQGYRIKPVDTSLFGFAGHIIYPKEKSF